MNGRFAVGRLLLVLLTATIVGVLSYSAGVSHGLAIDGNSHPWGWGWGFAPLFFLGFWFLTFAVFRGMLWGGMYRGCGYGRGRRMDAFDEWHRRAHEEMNKKS